MVLGTCNMSYKSILISLTLLHSEKPKLYGVLAFLSAIGLKVLKNTQYLYCKFQRGINLSEIQTELNFILSTPCLIFLAFGLGLACLATGHSCHTKISPHAKSLTKKKKKKKTNIKCEVTLATMLQEIDPLK